MKLDVAQCPVCLKPHIPTVNGKLVEHWVIQPDVTWRCPWSNEDPAAEPDEPDWAKESKKPEKDRDPEKMKGAPKWSPQ